MKTQLLTAVAALRSCREKRPDHFGPSLRPLPIAHRMPLISGGRSTAQIDVYVNGRLS
jgi:hypothetical protein